MREILTGAGLDELEEPATLLTSELVTNAVLHARSAPELVVRLVGRRLWVGVTDGTLVGPVRKHYGPQAGTGRGLLLVDNLASAWGTDTSDVGKVVWFELVGDDDVSGEPSSVAAFGGDRAEPVGGVDETADQTLHRRKSTGPKVSLRRPSMRSVLTGRQLRSGHAGGQSRRKGNVGR